MMALLCPLFQTARLPLLPDAHSEASVAQDTLFLLRIVSIDKETHQMLLTPADTMTNDDASPNDDDNRQFFIYRPSNLPSSLQPGDLIRMWGTLREMSLQALSPDLLKKKGDGSLPELGPVHSILEIHGKIATSSPGSRLDPTGVRRRLLKKRSPFRSHPGGGGSGRP